MNELTISITLTRKPELKFTAGGTSICNMSAYFTKKTGKKHPDGKDEYKAGWIDVSCFGEVADYAAGFEKGDKLDVRGMLDFRAWVPQGDTKEVQRLQVKAFEIQPKQAWTASGEKNAGQVGKQTEPVTVDHSKDLPAWVNSEDLPF